MIKYVVGLIFDPEYERVLLIKKARPSYLQGLWNGIGGKIEVGETPLQAMERETREETGLDVTNFRPFAVMRYEEEYIIYCFHGSGFISRAQSLTDEPVQVFPRDKLPVVVSNLYWMVPMARDVRIVTAEVRLMR